MSPATLFLRVLENGENRSCHLQPAGEKRRTEMVPRSEKRPKQPLFFSSSFILHSHSSFAYRLKWETLTPDTHSHTYIDRYPMESSCYRSVLSWGRTRLKRLNPWVVSESVSRCSSEGMRNVHLLVTKSTDQSFFFLFFFLTRAIKVFPPSSARWRKVARVAPRTWSDRMLKKKNASINNYWERKKVLQICLFFSKFFGRRWCKIASTFSFFKPGAPLHHTTPFKATAASSALIGVFLRLTRVLGRFRLSWTDTVEY